MTTSMYHVTPTANLPAIKEQGLVPQIGPRSQQLGEATAQVYLFPTLTAAEDALMNWLGEEFDEDEPLTMIAVDVDGLHLAGHEVGFEVVTTSLITPERLRQFIPV